MANLFESTANRKFFAFWGRAWGKTYISYMRKRVLHLSLEIAKITADEYQGNQVIIPDPEELEDRK